MQRRVSKVKRNYFWTALPNSPFTLVLTYPEPYGTYRIQHPNDSEMTLLNKKSDLLSFFSGRQWKIHPNWCVHCKAIYASVEQISISNLFLSIFAGITAKTLTCLLPRPRKNFCIFYANSNRPFCGSGRTAHRRTVSLAGIYNNECLEALSNL